MKDYIGKNLSKDGPKAVYDPKNKHVSVTYNFDLGRIEKVKLKSSCKIWLFLYYGLNFQKLTFAQIAPLLSRKTSKNKKDLLKNYSKLNPAEFGADVVQCFIAMLGENREYKARKISRKPPRYGLDWHNKLILSRHAAHLYTFLTHISKDPLPDYLLKCIEYTQACDGIDQELSIDTPNNRQDAVRRILSVFYNIKFNERFFQTYVTDSLINLRIIKNMFPNSPKENPFLISLFEDFL